MTAAGLPGPHLDTEVGPQVLSTPLTRFCQQGLHRFFHSGLTTAISPTSHNQEEGQTTDPPRAAVRWSPPPSAPLPGRNRPDPRPIGKPPSLNISRIHPGHNEAPPVALVMSSNAALPISFAMQNSPLLPSVLSFDVIDLRRHIRPPSHAFRFCNHDVIERLRLGV